MNLPPTDNDYNWLEEVEGESALEWVNEKNSNTLSRLKESPFYNPFFEEAQKILNDDERIPYGNIFNGQVYNLWKDKNHVKGIYRRADLEDYKNSKPNWETVLDLGELSEKENEDWVWGGTVPLGVSDKTILIELSRGGKDAKVVREFDLDKKEFIKEGVFLKESKNSVCWVDYDNLLVGTTLYEDGQTDSGYPRTVSLWKRGTELEKAEQIYEIDKSDVGVWSYSIHTGSKKYNLIIRRIDFYSSELFIYLNNKIFKLHTPKDIQFSAIVDDTGIFTLKSDWKICEKVFHTGSVISIPMNKVISSDLKAEDISVVINPTESMTIDNIIATNKKIYLSVLVDVIAKIFSFKLEGKEWVQEELELPGSGTVSFISADELNDNILYTFENFLTPTTLFLKEGDQQTSVKSQKSYFDASKFKIEQFKVMSSDGVLIPYFQVSLKEMKLDGKNKALLYGYGGFEISLTPSYSPVLGKLWLEQGGVYILSNIRGGGEFGPKWHQAALKENRQVCYDDFIAIAEDLISRKVTSPKHLGIQGGSNGGLLMGVMLTQRPDLFGAVLCQVPLLNMLRYHKLLAGASWMAEYGNPEIEEEREYISKYSPFQNLSETKKYPPTFFMTSTKDDRVHPAHARTMAAKMIAQGHQVEYFENTDGGHGGTTGLDDLAKWKACEYTFLMEKLS